MTELKSFLNIPSPPPRVIGTANISLIEAISTEQLTTGLLDTAKRLKTEQPLTKTASKSMESLQMSLQVSQTTTADQTSAFTTPEVHGRVAIADETTDLQRTAQSEILIPLQQSHPFKRVASEPQEASGQLIPHYSVNVADQETVMSEQKLVLSKPTEQTMTTDLVLAQSSAGIHQLALETESFLSKPEVETESAQQAQEISNELAVSQNELLDSSIVFESEKRKHHIARRSLDTKKLVKPVVISSVQHDESVSTMAKDMFEQNRAKVDLETEQPLHVQQSLANELEQRFHPERLRCRYATFQPLLFKSRSLSVERVCPLVKEHPFRAAHATRRRASVSFVRRRALQNSSQQTLDSQDSETTPAEPSFSRTASVSYTDLRAIQILGASKLEKETLFDQPQQIYDRLLPLIHLRPSERIQHFYHHSSMFNVPSTLGENKQMPFPYCIGREINPL